MGSDTAQSVYVVVVRDALPSEKSRKDVLHDGVTCVGNEPPPAPWPSRERKPYTVVPTKVQRVEIGGAR